MSRKTISPAVEHLGETGNAAMTFVIRGQKDKLAELRKRLRILAIETERPLQSLYLEALENLIADVNRKEVVS